jgi:predicted outer membrane repeat protein
MGDGKWLSRGIRRKLSGKRSGGKKGIDRARGSDRGRLAFESLEDRRVLAAYLVNNFDDIVDGNVAFGSLRWAINAANGTEERDQIVFSEDALVEAGGAATIVLNGGVLNITQRLDILGPGARRIEIQQDLVNQRVFDINIGPDDEIYLVQISGVTISQGNVIGDDEKGGGIYNREDLLMVESVLTRNSAPIGGAIFNEFGTLLLDRSTLDDNNAGRGGGIANGPEDPEEDAPPAVTIFRNSTARENSAGIGGALFNQSGEMYIEHSTITENNAGQGGGVASWGNPIPEEGEPAVELVWTYSTHSIIYGNTGTDFDRVGQDDEGNELLPSVHTRGWNFVGTGNTTTEKITVGGMEIDNPDWTFGAPPPVEDPPQDPPPEPIVDYVDIDPELGDYGDYGGSMDVYLLEDTSPAIDAGDPELLANGFDQRGRHFTRLYDADGDGNEIIDVGSYEVQSGVFVVDTLRDITNGTYSDIYDIDYTTGVPQVTALNWLLLTTYQGPGNFSLREALEFGEKNPGLDTVLFSTNLISAGVLAEEDVTPSKEPTILLQLGALPITEDTIILGPDSFILEIDASGNDPTPNSNNGDGSRVFFIDDNNSLFQSTVYISNLTLMGADVVGRGGGIFTREDLTLSQMTLKENNATDDGGALFIARGDALVEGSTFNNNRASDDGGAIFVDTLVGASQSNLKIVNSTFSANVAGDRGAGVHNNNSKVDVYFSTFTLNDAGSTLGSGIHNTGADALTSVWATVVSNNKNSDVSFSGGAPIASYESLGNNYIGKGNGNTVFIQPGDSRNANTPMLAPLFNTGGLVETHRPLAGSPLIDTGPVVPAGSDPALPETDQRGPGYSRVFDGNQDGLARADIGAYELQGLTLKVDSPADENDGNFASGFFSLREAVQLANDNPLPDVIEFDPILLSFLLDPQDPVLALSSFNLLPGTPAAIRITDHLTINGPGMGMLAVDGSGLDDPSSLTGSRMFVIDDGNAATKLNVAINGLEFRNGLASQSGAAIYSKENLTLNETTFINNTTYADLLNLYTGLHGGAIYQETGKLVINNSLFTGNSTADAGADGGAIYVVDGILEINDATLSGNSTEQSGGDGGAIYVKNSAFTANFSSISGNITSGGVADGAGFFSENSTVTLNEVVVSGNSTIGSNSEGAGFAGLNSVITLNDTVVSLNQSFGNQSSGVGAYTIGGTLVANRSLFRENIATGQASMGAGLATSGGNVTLNYTSVTANSTTGSGSHGGGVANLGGVLVIRNSTIADNHATHAQSKGGGVYSDTNLAGTQSTLILNSTISTNSAPLRGAGVFNADGLTEIKHSTITNNTSNFLNVGSGVASQGNAATQTRVLSSIIAGNVGSAAGTGSDVDSVDANFTNSFVSLGYNVIGTGNSAAVFNQTGDKSGITNPLLGPLDSNGQAPNVLFELQTHALLAGSPAINAGSPSFNPNAFTPAMTTDQRGAGFARVKSGRIDAGSFESDLAPALPADFNGNGMVDGNDFLAWQRNFGKTGAIKADGDANGDGNVNAADLTAWKSGYGSVAASAAASTSATVSSTAALLAEEEAAPAPTPSLAASSASDDVLASAPAVESNQVEARGNRYGSLASLGRSSVAAAKATAAQTFDDSLLWNEVAGPKARVTSVFLDDERLEELDLLLSTDDDAAGDAVFAAWGEELL